MHESDSSRLRSLNEEILERVRRLFKVAPKVDGQTSEQYIGTLETTFQSISLENADPNQMEIAMQIKDLLDKDNNDVWRRGHKIERLLPNLFQGDQLRTELLRWIEEGKHKSAPFVDFYEKQIKVEHLDELDNGSVQSDDKHRALLLRLTGDLQWFNNERYVKRNYSRVAARRVTAMFVIAFIVFVVTILRSGQGFYSKPTTNSNTNASTNDSSMYKIQNHGSVENERIL